MRLPRVPPVVLAAVLATLAAMLPTLVEAQTLAQMRGARRVLVVAAPDARDPRLAAQRREVVNWGRGAAERDVTPIELVGDTVHGVDDTPAALRRRLGLRAGAFGVVLVGKDGRVALRSATVLRADDLARAIDAMPMRRAGLR